MKDLLFALGKSKRKFFACTPPALRMTQLLYGNFSHAPKACCGLTLAAKIDDAAHLSLKKLLGLLHQRVLQRKRLNAAGLCGPGGC